MNDIFSLVLEMSITATFIIGIIILIRIILNRLRMPKWISYLIWVIVFFRLVSPIAISSDASFFNFFENNNQELVMDEYIPQEVDYKAQTSSNNQEYFDMENDISMKTNVNKSNISYMEIISIIWFSIVIIMLLFGFISYFKLKFKLFDAIKKKGNIYESDKIKSPFVTGVIKANIYLPIDIDDKYLKYVITHERVHIKRKDHIIKIIAFIVLSIHWFNPFVWLAFRLMSIDMEMSCDEKATKKLKKEERADYGMILLKLSQSNNSFHVRSVAFGENKIKGRIKNILNLKKYPIWIISIILIIIISIAICLMTDPFERINLPKIDDINHVYIEEYIDYESIKEGEVGNDRIKKDIINEISDGRKTLKNSYSDVSTKKDYYKLEISTDNELFSFFIYKEANNYYAEKPYEGIYLISKEAYEEIKKAITKIETIKENISDEFEDAFYEIIKIDNKEGVIFEKAMTSNEEIELFNRIIFDYMIKSSAWPGQDVSKLDEYYIFRKKEEKTNEISEFYMYFLDDETLVMQIKGGRYSGVIDKTLYEKLTNYVDALDYMHKSDNEKFVWNFNPALSSVFPALPIIIDIKANSINVTTDAGDLYYHDEDGRPNYINCGHQKEYENSDVILWSPLEETPQIATLEIEIIENKKVVLKMFIDIIAIKESENSSISQEYEIKVRDNEYGLIMKEETMGFYKGFNISYLN